MTKSTLPPPLYTKIADEFKEIEHAEEHALTLNTTTQALNTRRFRGRLNEPSISVRGGYYFFKPSKKKDENGAR